MTAERPGGENPPDGDGLPASPANAEAPAVISFCPGFYILHSRYENGQPLAECDTCGVTGEAGTRCAQMVIAEMAR